MPSVAARPEVSRQEQARIDRECEVARQRAEAAARKGAETRRAKGTLGRPPGALNKASTVKRLPPQRADTQTRWLDLTKAARSLPVVLPRMGSGILIFLLNGEPVRVVGGQDLERKLVRYARTTIYDDAVYYAAPLTAAIRTAEALERVLLPRYTSISTARADDTSLDDAVLVERLFSGKLR